MVLNEHCASGLYGSGSWGRVGAWSSLEIGHRLWCGERQLPHRGLVDGDTLGEVFVVDLVVGLS